MGLLDDLKQEADQLNKSLSEEEIERREKEKRFEELLFSTMRKIFRYFDQLVSYVKVVNPEMEISYTVPGYGALDGLVQENYRIHVDSEFHTKRISLSFDCVYPKEIQFSVHGKSETKIVS